MAVVQPEQRPSDPWAAGLDPWAASATAAVSAPKVSAPQPQPQDAWHPFVKVESRGEAKSDGGTVAGCRGGRNSSNFARNFGAKGAGSQGRGRGRGRGPPIMQTQKVRDWHVDVAPQPSPVDIVDEDVKPSKGRGRNLVTPAWKASTGVAEMPPPPTLQHVQSNLHRCAGAETLRRPEPLREGHKREWLTKLSNALAGMEVEVLHNFGGLGPGDWLTCQAGELLSVIYACDVFAYAMAYCHPERRTGWLPVSHLGLKESDGHHEFLVRLGVHTENAERRLGLVWAKSSGQLPGLVVLDVIAGSLLDDWNIRCRNTFARDQVLAGDCITWVNGISEPDHMNAHLLELKRRAEGGVLPLPIRMRVLRASTLKAMLATGSFSLAEFLAVRSRLEKQVEESHVEVPQLHTADDDPWAGGTDPWAHMQSPTTPQESMAPVDVGVSQVCQSQVPTTRSTELRLAASLWQ